MDSTAAQTAPRTDATPTPHEPALIPRSVAIIMDGNGRWAQQRGLPRARGHEIGADVTREIVKACARAGCESLIIYSFSAENWKRPDDEVAFLMQLCVERLEFELPLLLDNNIRLVHIGARDDLPRLLVEKIDQTTAITAGHTGMTLGLAWNYGGRREITEAARRLARRAATGDLDPESITEQTLAAELYTAGLRDPDLLIRTGGEQRISNFLLWQLSYAELYVTSTLWPEFTAQDLHTAFAAYTRRQRRFGELR